MISTSPFSSGPTTGPLECGGGDCAIFFSFSSLNGGGGGVTKQVSIFIFSLNPSFSTSLEQNLGSHTEQPRRVLPATLVCFWGRNPLFRSADNTLEMPG